MLKSPGLVFAATAAVGPTTPAQPGAVLIAEAIAAALALYAIALEVNVTPARGPAAAMFGNDIVRVYVPDVALCGMTIRSISS